MYSIRKRPRLGRLLAACLLLFVLISFPDPAQAQTQSDRLLEDITTAFAGGNSRTLLKDGADRIEVFLFENSTLYSRGQAVYVLDSFFRQYPPRRCVLRESVKADESWFAAGHYWHEASERPLLVYMGLRLRDNRWELREIRIDEQPGQ